MTTKKTKKPGDPLAGIPADSPARALLATAAAGFAADASDDAKTAARAALDTLRRAMQPPAPAKPAATAAPKPPPTPPPPPAPTLLDVVLGRIAAAIPEDKRGEVFDGHRPLDIPLVSYQP